MAAVKHVVCSLALLAIASTATNAKQDFEPCCSGTGIPDVGSGGLCYEGVSVNRGDPDDSGILALTIENLKDGAGHLRFNYTAPVRWSYGTWPDEPVSFTMSGTAMMVNWTEKVVGHTHYVHNANVEDVTYCSDTDEIKVTLINELPFILKRSPCGMTHQDTTITPTPSPCGTGIPDVGSDGLCFEGSSVTRCDPGILALTIENLEDGAGHLLFNYTVPEGLYSDWADKPLSFTMSSPKEWRSSAAQRFIGPGGAPMSVNFENDGAYVLDVIYCSATDEMYVDFLVHGPMILKRSSCRPRGHRHTTTTMV